MIKTAVPQSSDWNNFWGLDQTKKFTQISWSKRRILRILELFTKKGGCALDAGCGSGFFSKYFDDRGMRTVSLDYSDEALKIAHAMTQGRTRTMKQDLLMPHISQRIKERFDVIFSDGLLEHFPEDQQDCIVKNFVSLLSEQGVIITFVPNRWSPWQIIRPFFMPGIEETPFVLNDLVALNQRHNLIVTSKGGCNTFPFAFSPDSLVGSLFGMLLFTIAKKNV